MSVAQAPVALTLGFGGLSPVQGLFPCLVCRQGHDVLFGGRPFQTEHTCPESKEQFVDVTGVELQSHQEASHFSDRG